MYCHPAYLTYKQGYCCSVAQSYPTLWLHGLQHTRLSYSSVDSDDKESAWNSRDLGSVPELGRSPGEGNGNPLQYSCLENPMDRGAWWAIVHGVAKSLTWVPLGAGVILPNTDVSKQCESLTVEFHKPFKQASCSGHLFLCNELILKLNGLKQQKSFISFTNL